MLLARTKGLTRSQATIRHALRNSLVPIFPMILGQFLSILSGSLVIEQIFGIPGVGAVFLNSIVSAKGADFDVFLFVGMFYTIIGLAGGIIVDLSYGFVDPRIRMGGGK
jgi:ABC-type dipeptide/oligopeptide/nickel transport system permease component